MSIIISCFAATRRSSLKSIAASSLTRSTTSERKMTECRIFRREAMNSSGSENFAARFCGYSRAIAILSKICLAM